MKLHRARKGPHGHLLVELDYAQHGRERVPMIRLPDDASEKQVREARVWAASVWCGHHHPDVAGDSLGHDTR